MEFSKYLQKLGDFIIPPTCPQCGKILAQSQCFCSQCWQKLIIITEPVCYCCGDMMEFDEGKYHLCNHCLREPPRYDIARSLLLYNNLSRRLIHRFKYLDQTHMQKCFNRLLYTIQQDFFQQVDYIIPVPLHPARLRTRKYNQASLLAHEIHNLFHIPVLYEGLHRVINTIPQVTLNGEERRKNLQEAFQVNPHHIRTLNHKTVVLVDDVMTTGSTMNHCALALKQATAVDYIKAFTFLRIHHIENGGFYPQDDIWTR